MSETDRAFYWAKDFALSNPIDEGQDDLPKLLRRVADEIENEGIAPEDILDVVVWNWIESFGPHWHVTVYWSDSDPPHPLRQPSGASDEFE